ncbi:MAG: phosphonate ABC transporter ATP-binding protein [Leptothrix sp. (in: Bacteria)]|nr:phosphonate ABC transporter ATP-binding protein [Leptothrix sp. (in: b-proteobacteria)]
MGPPGDAAAGHRADGHGLRRTQPGRAPAHRMSTAVITAQGLQVSVATQVLLRDVALRITAGERVALVGHNGAGKSTLLRALTGFGRVTQGRLQVLDTDLSAARPAATLRRLRTRVAQVHQGLHLVGRLSAIDNVLIGGAGRHASPWTWLRRWPAAERRAAQAALVRVGLGAAAQRRTDTLSGGERQKVAIARALHQGGPLLLADEPTASLDAEAADDVAGLLADVTAERRATLVCVVHDLDLLPRLADRAIALRRGILVADVAVDAHTPAQLRGLLK